MEVIGLIIPHHQSRSVLVNNNDPHDESRFSFRGGAFLVPSDSRETPPKSVWDAGWWVIIIWWISIRVCMGFSRRGVVFLVTLFHWRICIYPHLLILMAHLLIITLYKHAVKDGGRIEYVALGKIEKYQWYHIVPGQEEKLDRKGLQSSISICSWEGSTEMI